jgi:L-ascorbate metabolism protein UlaG (beta-lactamase superfamily)
VSVTAFQSTKHICVKLVNHQANVFADPVCGTGKSAAPEDEDDPEFEKEREMM